MECTPEKARRNTLLKHRLAAYSQTVLKEVVAEEAIDYNRSERGILYFHRDQQSLDRGVEHMKLLEFDGQVIKVLDREGVIALEPSLASAKSKIAGGIYCPTDETGESPNSLEPWRPRSSPARAKSAPARPSPGSRRTATASRRR